VSSEQGKSKKAKEQKASKGKSMSRVNESEMRKVKV
jgi:hypothetical protein